MSKKVRKLMSFTLMLVMIISTFSIGEITASAGTVIENAISWALDIANDNSHGYSQLSNRRWGNPDYDCSSFVITAFKNAGCNVGSATYTGNMRSVFVDAGFTWIPKSQINLSNSSQLQRGDILLNEKNHTEIYIGNNQRVGAHSGTYDIYDRNAPGDNNGKEICVYNYSNSSNWDGILRYKEETNPPTNVYLDKNQNWYDINDTVTLIAHADNATYYWISIIKDNQHIVKQLFDGVMSFSGSQFGQGSYEAWITAGNLAGDVDSKHIYFSVGGEVEYSKIYTSREWYELTDTISISVDTEKAKGQCLGIDKEGVGRVFTGDTSSTYTCSAKDLGVGKFSAYFTVFNSSGMIDTKRVNFSIVDRIPTYDNFKISNVNNSIVDDITFSVDTQYAKYLLIGINKESGERIITKQIDNMFTLSSKDLGVGKFQAYITVSNNKGYVDTNKISFEIVNTPIEVQSVYYRGHTYKFYKTNYDWEKSKQWCEENGGHLATFTSNQEWACVKGILTGNEGGNYWLGADNNSGTWQWVTGEKFDYNDWGTDQPDNQNTEKYLGSRYSNKDGEYRWNNYTVSYHDIIGFVCEFDGDETPQEILKFEYNGHTYKIYNADFSWTQAEEWCKKKKGHLATVTDECEWSVIKESLITNKITHCWLGAESTSGEWKWVTGEDFKINFWDNGQPDNANGMEYYLGTFGSDYYNSYTWNDFKVDSIEIGTFIYESEYVTSTGDINDDGTVNIDDITLIQKYLTDILDFSDSQKSIADVNGDGDIMIDDTTMIQKYLAGNITELG